MQLFVERGMFMKLLPLLLCLFPIAAFAAVDDDCMTRRDVPSDELTLPDVIELGLCRNPQTSSAYLSYQSTRFARNAGYAAYLPSVNASASASMPYRNKEWGDWNYGASLSASYLIFDFGRRFADVQQLSAQLRAAGFDYDDTVQNYVYGVIGAYYALLNANADVASAKSLLTVAQTARDTAQKKYKAGVVARADVLKADTTLASRELDLARAQNNRAIAAGNLLAKLSFPADSDIKIADMPAEFGGAAEIGDVGTLIEMAKKSRPDLLRATANKDAAWHKRNSTFLSNLPSISASGTLSWNDTPSESFNSGADKVSGSIGIRASMPIFAGFANMYGVRAANANYERAIEQERLANDNAVLDVFTAYNNYKTATGVLTQTQTLLTSATESERVTSGMYKVGRATMLDWQTAQSELVDAQKQHNAAKYDLFTKRAAVALAIGELKIGVDSQPKITTERENDQEQQNINTIRE